MIGPKKPCRHGGDPRLCRACKGERSAAAKKGAATRKATGTNWGRAEFWDWDQPEASIPDWLACRRTAYGSSGKAIVLTKNGIVHSASKSPVWLVDEQTYFVEELLTRERLAELLRGRIVIGRKATGMWAPFARLTIAPQSAIDTGEDLEPFGLGDGLPEPVYRR